MLVSYLELKFFEGEEILGLREKGVFKLTREDTKMGGKSSQGGPAKMGGKKGRSLGQK